MAPPISCRYAPVKLAKSGKYPPPLFEFAGMFGSPLPLCKLSGDNAPCSALITSSANSRSRVPIRANAP